MVKKTNFEWFGHVDARDEGKKDEYHGTEGKKENPHAWYPWHNVTRDVVSSYLPHHDITVKGSKWEIWI